MSSGSRSAARQARHKQGLIARGGRMASLALAPETVKAAEFLVGSGWAPSLTVAVNKAVQALADAQRMVGKVR